MATLKISDLSVGDWVRVINQFDAQIDGYHSESGSLSLKTRQRNLVHYRLEDILPIPITPEILEVNGWRRREEDECMEYYVDPTSGIDHVKGTFRYRLEATGASVVCYFVHEFQHALRLARVDKEINL